MANSLKTNENSNRDAFAALEAEAKALESELKPRQVKFARIFAEGTHTQGAAAQMAGYSALSSHSRACEMLKNEMIIRLLDCYREADHLKNGWPKSRKRAVLAEIMTREKSRDSDKISATRLMAEMDSDLKPDTAGATTIVVTLPWSAGQQPMTIEGEAVDDATEIPSLESKGGGRNR